MKTTSLRRDAMLIETAVEINRYFRFAHSFDFYQDFLTDSTSYFTDRYLRDCDLAQIDCELNKEQLSEYQIYRKCEKKTSQLVCDG